MEERKGGNRLPSEAKASERVEADVVRFEVEKLPSGLFRHSPAKFVFEISRQEREGRLRKAVAAT